MSGRLGSQIGLMRRGTILKYFNDGTILVGIDEGNLAQAPQKFKVPIPLAWSGPEGEFMGGYPRTGSSVILTQGQGGEWFVLSYINSDQVFSNTNNLSYNSAQNDLMSTLKPGRAVMQVKGGTRLFLDPTLGIQAGTSNNFLQLNPKTQILSHNFLMNLEFTEAARKIEGVIKRDLIENSNRNILGSTLDSQAYDATLTTIGMDPTSAVAANTLGLNIRNLPLVEQRQMVYEFANSFGFTSDSDEHDKYINPQNSIPTALKVNKRNMRTDALSLSLEAPNQLIEEIKGTVVDSLGNILDLNREVLPLGTVDVLSLVNNTDKGDAFAQIRAQLRKSVAYHLQINTRHGGLEDETMLPPDVTDTSDYLRAQSQFSFDVDKEGQTKINIPASSEIGNLPMLVRHTNYSNLAASQDTTISPNSFIKSSTNQDIFLTSFAGKASIKLSASDTNLDGYEAPIDYLTDQPMSYGTAFHDITATCSEFTTSANYLKAGLKLVNFDPNNHLNTDYIPIAQVVSDTITVSGPQANAGGRSACINLDGFLMLNIGANTIDRQSLWMDLAGGAVMNFGRDIYNNSLVSQFDGAVLWQVGGPGIGNSFDKRFSNANDSYINSSLEFRVLLNGSQMIFRMGPTGIDIISPGTINFSCQQDMTFKSNATIKFASENFMVHAEDSKRLISKFPNTTI